MKKTTKILALFLAAVLLVASTAAVTVALLTATDEAINVMVAGNVMIEQLEKERDASGALQDFTQNKPWLPVTTKIVEKKDSMDWAAVGAPGTDLLYDSNAKGVQDKFVFVENTGTTDAYVRTIIAYESPVGLDASLLHINDNAALIADEFYTTLDGVRYLVREYLYPEAVKPNEVTRPSLLQVYLDYYATNADNLLFNGKMDIRVLSQAVQAGGFDTAVQGLNEAFGEVNAVNVAKWLGGADTVEVTGGDKAAVLAAINSAQPGDIITLSENTTIAGYTGDKKLVVDKPIIIDLNGKTLTTESGWGGIDLKGGGSIVNGVINHTGNTAAIKAFQVDTIENVIINVTETAGKVKGGIVLQSGNSYINTLRNVTINGATNGIECYYNAADLAIGTISNVKIKALANGIYLNGGGKLGTVENVTIEAGDTGIRGDLLNVWSIDLNLVNCSVKGGKYGVDIWDEAPHNPGTVTVKFDDATTFDGGEYKIKITLNDEVKCTYQGVVQTSPVTIYEK